MIPFFNSALGPIVGSKEDDWSGISNRQKRKRLQNRLNQRAYRERRRRARPELAFGHDADSELVSPLVLRSGISLNSYPSSLLDPVVRDVLFFARDKLWPTFHPYLLSSHPWSAEPLSEAWFRRVLTVPLMRHSIVAATCLDLELLTGRDYSATNLWSVNELIKEVRLLMATSSLNLGAMGERTKRDARPNIDDDLLFAVMSLAKANTSPESDARPRSVTDSSPEIFGFFKPPLQTLQSLHVWGQQTARAVHFSALEQLVLLKGGLSRVTTPGFADALHLFDVHEAAKTLDRPRFEIPVLYVRFLERVRRAEREESTSVNKFLALGIAPESPLVDILRDIRVYCQWIDGVIRSTVHDSTLPCQPTSHTTGSARSTCELTTLRNLIEYQLLAHQPANATERICRTATMIFTHGCIFPIPSRAPMRRLVAGLISLLQPLENLPRHHDLVLDKGFLAWVSMMGALAADQADREFFTSRLATCATAMDISSWTMLKETVGEYLWLEEACDAGGMEVWAMIFHETER